MSWLAIASATGQLALGLLAVRHAGRSAVALPLAGLGFVVFGWTAANLAYQSDRELGWRVLDHTLSPLTAPLLLHLVLAFTGRRRRLRWALAAAYTLLGALAASASLALFWGPARTFQTTGAWDAVHLALALPVCALAVASLLGYLREPLDPDSRRRAWLLLCAFAIGIPLAATELLPDAAPLADLGTLIAAVLLAIAALRLRLLDEDLSTSAVTLAVGLAALIFLVYATVFDVLVAHLAALILATASAAVLLGLVVRHAVHAGVARRARAEQLVILGRFAAQVAHDLKNPLAALKGAAQFLAEEGRRGVPLDGHGKYPELISTQVDRMQRALDDVGRLSRIEPVRGRVDANELAREIGELAGLSAARVTTRISAGAAPLVVSADRDLVTRALENLVKNAVEAMPDGGTLTVSAALSDDGAGVDLSITDTGKGMDAATCERALDDFFTTKDGGSGLGLSFCRRVALAHGGELRLSSGRGRGTVAKLTLPVYREGDVRAPDPRRG